MLNSLAGHVCKEQSRANDVPVYLSKHLGCYIKHAQMHDGWWIEAATVDQDHRMVT